MLTNQVIEGFVSARRLKIFLDGDELQPDAREITINPNLCPGDVVRLTGLSYWTVSDSSVPGV
jgi:hypothetical protein